MSKTYKDKANHFIHHVNKERQDSNEKVTELIERMVCKVGGNEVQLPSGLRHGNNRNVCRNLKITERRIRRCKDKQRFLLDTE